MKLIIVLLLSAITLSCSPVEVAIFSALGGWYYAEKKCQERPNECVRRNKPPKEE